MADIDAKNGQRPAWPFTVVAANRSLLVRARPPFVFPRSQNLIM